MAVTRVHISSADLREREEPVAFYAFGGEERDESIEA